MSESRHSNADRLERRARWLLRAYPAAYRADWGEEIAGTLLEAIPSGRDWPPPRETASLIAAGLRARRAANLRQGLAASLRQTAMVGAALYLVQLPALGIGAVVWGARRGHLPFLFPSSHCLWLSAGWQPTSARWPASSLPSPRAGLSTVSPMAALWLRSRRP